MRVSGALLAETMRHTLASLKPGMTTKELDQAAEDFIRSRGAVPAFKGFKGYPATLCISINEQVVHGIPGNRIIHEGDLVGIDCGLIINGYYSDMARTVQAGNGEPPKTARDLMEVTRKALDKGIEKMCEGNRLGDISHAVQTEIEKHGFSVIRALVGHGIGRQMQESPQVPNFGNPGTGLKIRNGMVFAIEPMVNVGHYAVKTLSDDWTIVSSDGSLSCHFENTVAATPDGPEILTRLPEQSKTVTN
jgi:methionyl aminopeptidase